MRCLAMTGLIVLVPTQVALAQPLAVGKLHYLRPAGAGWAHECTFTIAKRDNGWAIHSVTERGSLKLTLDTAYLPNDMLTTSIVKVRSGDKESVSIVAVRDDKASVQLWEKPLQILQVSPGTIVTSAPDWTDALLLCARYDHKKAGKQTMPGLWYHPEQGVQQLKFHIDRQGYDTIRHGDKNVKLGRFTIELRGKSRYAAWATMDGLLVRLIPLPAKAEQRTGLILDSYERSGAKDLAPNE
jgi:hypothetical protein